MQRSRVPVLLLSLMFAFALFARTFAPAASPRSAAAAMTYTTPLANPWVSATLYAGGAYFEQVSYSLYLPALTR